jgi:hypothetical protein
MRNQAGMPRDLRIATKAIREMSSDRAPGGQIAIDEERPD